MRATITIDGRVVVRVSELAEMMGVCGHTVFGHIRQGRIDSVLTKTRDRMIYLDSVVGASNVHRPFVDAAQAARMIQQSPSRIYRYVRLGKIDHVKGPGRTTLIFLDTLTKPDFKGKELLTPKAARTLMGLGEEELLYLIKTGGVGYVTIPSGLRRIIKETLTGDPTSLGAESPASLSA